jgi:hypothetical protein
MNAVTKHEPRGQVEPIVSENAAVMAIIERAALNPDVDAAKMDQLFALQEKVLSRNARTEYFRALAMMAGAMPAIAENGKGHNGTKYAKWEDIQSAITPVLGQYGFALSFRTKVEDKAIRVTAILAHREGHTEENELLLPADNSGSKNAVQAVGSSITYGFRYTACALLNIQTGITDDDGRAAHGPATITDAQLVELQTMILNTGSDEKKFLAFLKIDRLSDLPAERFAQAMGSLRAKANAGSKS